MSAEPSREQVDMLAGATVLEFGAAWCGICQGTRPLFEEVLGDHAQVRHIQIEDGKGRRLGRTFGVKLWPTFVFLRDGKEVARVVRPRSAEELRGAFRKLS
jgi:thioredoxin 1